MAGYPVENIKHGKNYTIIDYLKIEGGNLPEFDIEPDGYQSIIIGHEIYTDDKGVQHEGEESFRTTYSNINEDGMEDEAAALVANYKDSWEAEITIVRVFIRNTQI